MKLIAQIAAVGFVAGGLLAATMPKAPRPMSIDYDDYQKMAKLDPVKMVGNPTFYELKPEHVAKVFPELVQKGAGGKVEVNYQQLTIILLQQVQDLQRTVTELEDLLIDKE